MRLHTGVMPFMLVYGVEPVLLVEIELPAARLIAIATQLDPFNNDYATECITTLECLKNIGVTQASTYNVIEKRRLATRISAPLLTPSHLVHWFFAIHVKSKLISHN